jgi:hypothetical protein
VPAGLALMHGFSATNVGKNRLTVRRLSSNLTYLFTYHVRQFEALPRVGLYGKGKASDKIAQHRHRRGAYLYVTSCFCG